MENAHFLFELCFCDKRAYNENMMRDNILKPIQESDSYYNRHPKKQFSSKQLRSF